MIKLATKRLINSVWTLEYNQIDDDNIEILNFSRDNQIGYDKEKSLERISMVENDDRTVTGVRIGEYDHFKYSADSNDKLFNVVNKKYVFSYGD